MVDFEYELDGGKATIYVDDDEEPITTVGEESDPVRRPSEPPYPSSPPIKQAIAEWIADQSVPDEQKFQDAIERLAAVQAGHIHERGNEDLEDDQ